MNFYQRHETKRFISMMPQSISTTNFTPIKSIKSIFVPNGTTTATSITDTVVFVSISERESEPLQHTLQQNRPQSLSPRRRSGLLGQRQQDPNAVNSTSSGCSMSSLYDTPSVIDMNDQRESTSSTATLAAATAVATTMMKRRFDVTRRQQSQSMGRLYLGVKGQRMGFATFL